LRKGFTLLELIIVIIIVGILATVGLNQYTKQTEGGRCAEARAIFGTLAKRMVGYYLETGNMSTIVNANIGVGTSSEETPSTCRSSYYFRYDTGGTYSATGGWLHAYRCTSGGKEPQGANYCVAMFVDATNQLSTGQNWFAGRSDKTSQAWVYDSTFSGMWGKIQ